MLQIFNFLNARKLRYLFGKRTNKFEFFPIKDLPDKRGETIIGYDPFTGVCRKNKFVLGYAER